MYLGMLRFRTNFLEFVLPLYTIKGSNATPDALQTAKTVMFSWPTLGRCFQARFPFKNLKRKILSTEK